MNTKFKNDYKKMQSNHELEKWYEKEDPWEYKKNSEDEKRLDILLSEIPNCEYERVLDIGCGEGFVTRRLPGRQILGIDISKTAIKRAQQNQNQNLMFRECSIFDLDLLTEFRFNLIIITGVLYQQYIGRALPIIYFNIDRLLEEDGVLISVHIDDWYRARFPFLLMREHFYNYREYTHRLQVYVK